ncbi:MAG: hypothetical protein R2729_32930 [Bryobacteraceae bacterium]
MPLLVAFFLCLCFASTGFAYSASCSIDLSQYANPDPAWTGYTGSAGFFTAPSASFGAGSYTGSLGIVQNPISLDNCIAKFTDSVQTTMTAQVFVGPDFRRSRISLSGPGISFTSPWVTGSGLQTVTAQGHFESNGVPQGTTGAFLITAESECYQTVASCGGGTRFFQVQAANFSATSTGSCTGSPQLGDGQTGVVGIPLKTRLTATFRNANGGRVTSFDEVVWESNRDDVGVDVFTAASVTATLGSPGPYVIAATLPGCESAKFTATAVPADSANCSISPQAVKVSVTDRTTMNATFTPEGNQTLASAASSCGFIGFNYQQLVTAIPCPSPYRPLQPQLLPSGNFCQDGTLTAPPSFYDPVPGGYAYLLSFAPYDAYPFYWRVEDAMTPGKLVTQRGNKPPVAPHSSDGRTLTFRDMPSDACLPGGDKTLQLLLCGGASAPAGSRMGFSTSLVGIKADRTASAPLFRWNWTDTFNGGDPSDPGNGGITLASIDGVDPLPSPVSVLPTSGAVSQPVVFTFSDPKGFQNLGVVNILINNVLDGRHACYMAYVQATNTLLLVNDAGDAGGPFVGQMVVDGSPKVIENRQCRINGVGSSRVANGHFLILTLNVTFSADLAGNRVMYLAARDLAENNSGWQALGVWQVPGSPAGVIAAVSASPARGTGSSQSNLATFTFSDTKGSGDIGVINILVNDFIDGRHGCYLAYVAQSKRLLLVNDAGDAGGPFAGAITLGEAATIKNGQCTVGLVSASSNGSTFTLTLDMSYDSSFSGNRIVFVAARDSSGVNNTGWQALGTWRVQ